MKLNGDEQFIHVGSLLRLANACGAAYAQYANESTAADDYHQGERSHGLAAEWKV